MHRLLAFYYGSHPDHRGRMLAEILRQDDLWLELTHDYIQWLFPLNEVSRVTPDAPLLDPSIQSAFRTDEVLRRHLRASIARMVRFYGLTFDGASVAKGPTWPDRKGEWFTENTHNSLRITRMLKCMRLLDLQCDAAALQAGIEHLCKSEPDCGITNESRAFWRAAVAG